MPFVVGRTVYAAICRTCGARESAEAVSQKASVVVGQVEDLAIATFSQGRLAASESRVLVARATNGQREVKQGRRGPRLPSPSHASPAGLRVVA